MPRKPIVYSKHALKRMAQRKVSGEDVEETLRHPSLDYPTKRKPKRRAIRTFGDREVHVIYCETPQEYIVITVEVMH